jgi:hypothetical protein
LETTPEKNKLIVQQIWTRVNSKYGFLSPTNAASTPMSKENLRFEIGCHRYHFQHMVDKFTQFPDRKRLMSALVVQADAHDLLDQLTKILDRLRHDTTSDVFPCQKAYERPITLPCQSIGSFYVDLCERLNREINGAELRCKLCVQPLSIKVLNGIAIVVRRTACPSVTESRFGLVNG